MYLLSSDQAAAVIICSIIEMGLSILLDISIILLINNTGLTGRGVPAPLSCYLAKISQSQRRSLIGVRGVFLVESGLVIPLV